MPCQPWSFRPGSCDSAWPWYSVLTSPAADVPVAGTVHPVQGTALVRNVLKTQTVLQRDLSVKQGIIKTEHHVKHAKKDIFLQKEVHPVRLARKDNTIESKGGTLALELRAVTISIKRELRFMHLVRKELIRLSREALPARLARPELLPMNRPAILAGLVRQIMPSVPRTDRPLLVRADI